MRHMMFSALVSMFCVSPTCAQDRVRLIIESHDEAGHAVTTSTMIPAARSTPSSASPSVVSTATVVREQLYGLAQTASVIGVAPDDKIEALVAAFEQDRLKLSLRAFQALSGGSPPTAGRPPSPSVQQVDQEIQAQIVEAGRIEASHRAKVAQAEDAARLSSIRGMVRPSIITTSTGGLNPAGPSKRRVPVARRMVTTEDAR